MYFRNKRRQNIGIVKMFFFGFDIVYIGQPKVTMDPRPVACDNISDSISPESDNFPPKSDYLPSIS